MPALRGEARRDADGSGPMTTREVIRQLDRLYSDITEQMLQFR